ncbi:phosphotransferase [Lentzea sp. CC55]|uniref:phosphotransferase n=1 Tax=Lentzea sp. CC55 TaxID=2884909 RepID=UPI0027E1FAB3|nr:phosphotransferase [Lentzea sp. CC55]MCG8923671.1 aminoglycoside phosphotransferase family protein [Lentzea sp. CC55]
MDDLGDRVGLWLEDVRCADTEWDLPRFRRAALGLGRWAGRRFGGAPGRALRLLYEGRLVRDAFLRPDCPPFAARVPELVRRLEALPQANGHNDACPQNLLVPAGDPESFVVIDVGYQCPNPIGADLGQLLVGLVHEGRMAVADLPPVHEAVVDAYLEGVRLENRAVSREEVVLGCDGMLAVRSAFHSEPELAGYLLERAAAL